MITKLLNEVNEKIETLNNLVQDKEYFEKLDERIEKANDYIQRQQQEIERLNNIINELEKWLKQQYGLDKEEWEYSSPYIWHEHITLEFVLNKLQELKEKYEILDKENK